MSAGTWPPLGLTVLEPDTLLPHPSRPAVRRTMLSLSCLSIWLSLLFGFWGTTYALFVIAFALFYSVILFTERIWYSVRKRGKAEGRNGVGSRIMLLCLFPCVTTLNNPLSPSPRQKCTFQFARSTLDGAPPSVVAHTPTDTSILLQLRSLWKRSARGTPHALALGITQPVSRSNR